MTPQSKPVRILYVEDDRDLGAMVKAHLAQAGYAVDLCYDGQEALARHAAGGYDLLAIDRALPVLDGLEVMRILASRGPLPPTVMITGTGNERTAVEAMKLGAGDYLVKDAGGAWLELLPGVIQRVLGQRRLVEEKQTAEAALREKEEQLYQSQKLEAIGLLAGGVAHEFNNLLTAVIGHVSLAMTGLAPEEKRCRDLEQALKAANRGAALTRQLLGFGRRQPLLRRNVPLNQVVADFSPMLRPLIGDYIGLDLALGEDVGTLYADPAQLQQVLLNLCLNARDAMPSGGRLTLGTQSMTPTGAFLELHGEIQPGPHVMLTVSDTGCGMPPEVMQHVFEPFYTTKPVGEGTGLGLSLVYGIVRQHGGAIDVQSAPGEGATFRIYLPRTDAATLLPESRKAV